MRYFVSDIDCSKKYSWISFWWCLCIVFYKSAQMTLQDKNHFHHFIAIFRTHTRILNCVIILTNNQIAVFKNDWEGTGWRGWGKWQKDPWLNFQTKLSTICSRKPNWLSCGHLKGSGHLVTALTEANQEEREELIFSQEDKPLVIREPLVDTWNRTSSPS